MISTIIARNRRWSWLAEEFVVYLVQCMQCLFHTLWDNPSTDIDWSDICWCAFDDFTWMTGATDFAARGGAFSWMVDMCQHTGPRLSRRSRSPPGFGHNYWPHKKQVVSSKSFVYTEPAWMGFGMTLIMCRLSLDPFRSHHFCYQPIKRTWALNATSCPSTSRRMFHML